MLKKAFRILGLLKRRNSFLRRPNEDQLVGKEIDEELAFHLERRSQDWVASGLTPAQARQRASQEFGDLEATRNYCRQISRRRSRSRQRERVLSGIGQDLVYAWRQLQRNPGFAAVAIVTLALGIGFNGAIFSLLDRVVLRPLPFREADRLVRVWGFDLEKDRSSSISNLSFPDFLDLDAQQQLLEGMGAWCEIKPALSGRPDRQALRLRVTAATADLLPLLGIDAALGRVFRPQEDQPGGRRAALLSHAFWHSYFGADGEVLGKSLLIEGQAYPIVGVLPSWFRGNTAGAGRLPSGQAQVWLPYRNSPAMEGSDVRGFRNLSVIARLKQEVSLDQAEAEVEAIAARLASLHPVNANQGAWLQPVHQALTGDVKSTLLLLFAAVGLVLLIACSNVANLMLGRLQARGREIAVRSAIGASRSRILRQLLTESLLLAGLGGILAIAVAESGIQLILAAAPQGIPRLDVLSLDARVLAFLLAASTLSGVAFGVLPALQMARRDPQSGLREGLTASRSSPARSRLRGGLVVCQIALAVVLVSGAGLLLRSFSSLLEVQPGFDPRNVLVADLKLSGPAISHQWPRAVSFFEQLVERAERLPGVERACIAFQHPLRAGWNAFFEVEGKPPMAPGQQRSAILRPVGPGYFEMLGIALQRGRSLTAQDDSRAVGAAIVNQAFVRRFLPAQDPLQQRLQMSHWWGARPPEYQVVGVVSDVRFAGLDSPPAPAIYLPHAQWPVSEASLLVKTQGDPLSLAPYLRTEVAALDPTLPVDGVTSLELELGDSLRQHRFTLLLLGSFASTALLLASLGVYGLLSFLVSRRRAEIGLRLALGADRQDVLISTLGQALRLVAPGLAIGLVLALGLSRFLAGLLYGVSPLDPATYAGVVFVLLLSALLASFLPALRATRVDPIQVLRSE